MQGQARKPQPEARRRDRVSTWRSGPLHPCLACNKVTGNGDELRKTETTAEHATRPPSCRAASARCWPAASTEELRAQPAAAGPHGRAAARLVLSKGGAKRSAAGVGVADPLEVSGIGTRRAKTPQAAWGRSPESPAPWRRQGETHRIRYLSNPENFSCLPRYQIQRTKYLHNHY